MSDIATAYEKAFASGRKILRIGALHVPSGRLVACDPFFARSTSPFAREVAPGDYEVELSVTDSPEWGPRHAMARVVIASDGEAPTFEPADRDFADTNWFPVEAGLGSFMDEVAREAFVQRMVAFYQANPKGNYYDDVLASEFKQHADPADTFDEGSWNMHVLPGSSLNVAMFSSGLGDGSYRTFWVLNERGEVTALVIDFDLANLP